VLLIHVKKANGAGLRELFAQGYVAASAYRDVDFREAVHKADINGRNQLSVKDKKVLASLERRRKREFTIVFAIHDDTPSNRMKAGATTTSGGSTGWSGASTRSSSA